MQFLGIAANSVFHLVLNAPPPTPGNPADGISDETIRAILESTRSSVGTGRRSGVTTSPEADIADRQEAIRQNLMALRGLCDMMTSDGFSVARRVF